MDNEEDFGIARLFIDERESRKTVEDVSAEFNKIFRMFMGSRDKPAPVYADQKSVREANRFRLLAMEEVKKRDFREASKFLTRSIASAPFDSEELIIGHAERADVLFSFYDYEGCLLDVNRALKGRCKESLKKKLRKLKRRCWQQYLLSKEDRTKAIDEEATDPYEHRLKSERAEWRDLCIFHPPNELLPNGSPKVKLIPVENKMARLVATQDIVPGKFGNGDGVFWKNWPRGYRFQLGF